MSADTAMFGDDNGVVGWRLDTYSFPTYWTTYYPSDIQWEVARQMNADFVRLLNQEVTIAQLQSDLAASRAECERLRADAERYRWLRDPSNAPAMVIDKVVGHSPFDAATRTGGYPLFEYRAGAELDTAIDQSRQALEPTK